MEITHRENFSWINGKLYLYTDYPSINLLLIQTPINIIFPIIEIPR